MHGRMLMFLKVNVYISNRIHYDNAKHEIPKYQTFAISHALLNIPVNLKIDL